MLMWLSGVGQHEGRAERELRPRADGAVHARRRTAATRENDVREQARALTGFRNDWDDGVGPNNFRFDPELPRRRRQEDLRQARAASTGATPAGCASTHRSHPSFFVEKLWSYFIPTPPRPHTRRALERLYVAGNYAVRPVRRGDPPASRPLRGPAHGEAAGRLRRRACCAAMGRGVDTESWTWLGHLMGQQLFYPPNVAGLGRRPLARQRHLAGALAAPPSNVAARTGELDPTRTPYDPTEDAADGGRPRARVLGQPDDLGADPRAAARAFAQRCRGGADQRVEEEELPAAAPERPAHAGRHLPRPPDLLTMARLPLRRLLAHRAPEAAPRRGRRHAPARASRGMPAPAGTGLDRRQFLLRSAGRGADASTARRGWTSPRSRRASRRPRRARRSRCSSRSSCPAAIDSLSVLAPVGDPKYRELRPKLALRRLRGHAVQRGRPAALAPVRGSARDAARRGQGDA